MILTKHVDSHMDELVSDLQILIRQPSVSAKNEGIEECAVLVQKLLTKSGIKSEILRLKKGAAPIVYGGWYNPSWYNPWSYWGGPCKDGCTSIGNGEWGCQSPGNQVNDCLFASDCRGCDRNRDVKRAEHKGWGWW